MPWGNTIDVVTIAGETLKSVLEHSVSKYDPNDPDPGGRFVQVSGLVLKFDIRKAPGQRLLSAFTGKAGNPDSWKPIEDEKLYDVAVPSFLAFGGDQYKMIPDFLKEYKNTGFLDTDLIVAYLQNHNPLQLPEPGRITILSSADGTSSAAVATTSSSKTSTMLLAFDCCILLFMLLPLSLLV